MVRPLKLLIYAIIYILYLEFKIVTLLLTWVYILTLYIVADTPYHIKGELY